MTGLVATVAIIAGVALIVLLRSPGGREPRKPAPAAPPEASAPAGPKTEAPKEPAPKASVPKEPAQAVKVEPPGPREEPAKYPDHAKAPETAPTPKPVPPAQPAKPGLPRIAIVLDDCGQSADLMARALRLKHPITFAVIPHLPQSTRSAEMAHDAGQEIIVHQPMQPESRDEDPGAHAILTGMKADRVSKILKSSFDDVPHAVGLNNHMGSKATADRALMETVVASLERVRPGALFLDSRTTPATVAAEIARKQGLPTAERAVFLDNDLKPEAIRGELTRLIGLAAEKGEAVAIGHLKAETLDVLEQEVPRLDGRHCRFVFLSALVR